MPTFETARPGLLWDATAVPNAFFCEYMPAAPEGYVKIYLYGLMWAHSGVLEELDALEELARALNTDEAEVERALRYWERCRLVERVQDKPARYRFVSVQQVMIQRQQMPHDEAYEAFAQAVYSAFGDRRKLHGGETVLAYEWVEQYQLPAEVVLMLIQHMISTRGVHFSFKDAQKVAMELCEQKVTTIEAAEMVFSRSEAAMRGARKILSHLGIRRSPSMDEIDLYLKWTAEWGFEPKAILEACKETTKGAPTFGYLDKVLEGLYSRSGGKATSEGRVQRALQQEKEETIRVRELLQTLGISLAVVDEGMRAQYRAMAGDGGHELVMLAAREVARSAKANSLENVVALLEAWRQRGLRTAEEAQAHLAEVKRQNDLLLKLKEAAGGPIARSDANRQTLTRWQKDWGFSEAMLALAAEFARGKKEPMSYMDTLLTSWHENGIVGLDAARAEHERRMAQGKVADAAPAKRVVEQRYAQRAYDPAQYDDIPEDQLEEMNRS